MDKKEILEIEINTELKLRKKELINKLKSIIRDCNMEIQMLENNENYCPNSLGMLQYEGVAVDVLCGKISVLNNIKEKLD